MELRWSYISEVKHGLFLIAFMAGCTLSSRAQVQFSELTIDPQGHGDDKAIADLDNDGVKDIILGGSTLNWYKDEHGVNIKYHIIDPRVEFTTDMGVGDVDNDGDIDLIVADGDGAYNVMWLENPLPENSPATEGEWNIHLIGSHGTWMHNAAVGDVNMDRHLDVISSGHGFLHVWLNRGDDTWQDIVLSPFGGGPVDVYDMDNDGDLDVITMKGWVECPADAFKTEAWKFHPVAGLGQTVKATDLDQDGDADLLSADSAHTVGKLYWLRPTTGLYDSIWTKKEIDPACGSHKLQVADFNRDGYPDILFGLELKALGILYQDPHNPGSFRKETIAAYGGHNAIAGDIDNDGDLDIVSCDYLNHPPLRLFVNNSAGKEEEPMKPLSVSRWHYDPITHEGMRTFGLAFGEFTGDGKKDIVAGSYVYENPGSDHEGAWKQYLIREGLHGVVAIDIDDDGKDEIIATTGEGTVYWCEGSRGTWKIHELGSVPRASHPIGSQGQIAGQIIPGGKPGIVLTAGGGTYAFQIPQNPASRWPMIHITSHTSDEDVDLADINHDGWNDVVGTLGETHEVFWFENPKRFKSDWREHKVGQLAESGTYLDRVVSGDLNGDGRADIVVSEETQNGPASTVILYQPAAKANAWTQKTLVNQYTTNSMDAADIDLDGDLDLITAEHRGEKRLTLWQNDGNGNFKAIVIDRGKENHDGAKLVDLDGDGDLDIVGIGYDAYSVVHVWWNDAVVK